MTDTDSPEDSPPKRRAFEAPGEDVQFRQDDEAGVFELRMPIASTGEVRNEGDDPLTRDEIQGMARQIDDGGLGVFPDHGKSALGGPTRYSIAERGGEWTDPEVVSEQDADSDADLLMATARMMDPDTLPDIPVRNFLGTVKELADRDMSVASSIGWRDDDSAPGGVDLMEVSLVGIPADPRTHSDAGTPAVARAAVAAGADADALVAQVRQVVEHGRPLGPPSDPDRFDTFDDCVQALMDDQDISREEAERICGAWEQQNHDMTDNTDQSADDADTEQDDEPDESRDAPEWAERMLELQQQTVDVLVDLRAGDDDEDDDEDEDEDEDEDDEDEQSADDPDGDSEADTDGEQSGGDDADDEDQPDREALQDELEELRAELDDLRDGPVTGEDVDTPDTDEDRGGDGDEDTTTSQTTESATKRVLNQ